MKQLLGLLLLVAPACGVELLWDANVETNVGYKVYIGTGSRAYQTNFTTTNTSFTIANTNLFPSTNYFSVTAFYLDDPASESEYSDEVFWIARPRLAKPTGLRVKILTVQSAPSVLGPWTDEGQLAFDLAAPRFFRLAIGAPPPSSMPAFKRLAPTSGSKTGKLPLMTPKRPVQGLPFPPG